MTKTELIYQLGNSVGTVICLRDADGVLHDLGVEVTGFDIEAPPHEVSSPDHWRRFEPGNIVTGMLQFTSGLLKV